VVYFRLFLYHLKLRGKERLCVITWLHWPGEGAGCSPIYNYVDSQMLHPWGRKFSFFLTYCN
jgi:hypothetical protein